MIRIRPAVPEEVPHHINANRCGRIAPFIVVEGTIGGRGPGSGVWVSPKAEPIPGDLILIDDSIVESFSAQTRWHGVVHAADWSVTA